MAGARSKATRRRRPGAALPLLLAAWAAAQAHTARAKAPPRPSESSRLLVLSLLEESIAAEAEAFLHPSGNGTGGRRTLLQSRGGEEEQEEVDRGPPVFRPHSPLLKRIEPHTLEETVLSSPGIAATTIGKDGVLAPPVRGSLRKAKGKEESMQQHKRFLVHFKDEITVRLAPTDDTLASSRVRTIPLTRDAMEAACSQFLGEESWCGEDDRQRAKLRRGDDSTATKANALGAGGKEVHADEASTGGARYSNGILENLLVVSAWITEEEVARMRVALRPFLEFIEEDAPVEVPDRGARAYRETDIFHIDESVPDPSEHPDRAVRTVLEHGGHMSEQALRWAVVGGPPPPPPPPPTETGQETRIMAAPPSQTTGSLLNAYDRSPSSIMTLFNSIKGTLQEEERDGALDSSNNASLPERMDALRSHLASGGSLSDFGNTNAQSSSSEMDEQQQQQQQIRTSSARGTARASSSGSVARSNDQGANNRAFSWVLDRIDQARLPLDRIFERPHSYTGYGVTVFVLDTGWNRNHEEFTGKQEVGDRLGRSFRMFDSSTVDSYGHGTHVAALAAGLRSGVAPGANIVPLAVMDSQGKGSIDHVVQALNYIYDLASRAEALNTGDQLGGEAFDPRTQEGRQNLARNSVVVMSLRGPRSVSLNRNIARLSRDLGIVCVTASGNDAADAHSFSPPDSPDCITVGATTTADSRAEYSNYGPAVDILAPGSNVRSAYHTGTDAYATLSGTSMAAPVVAGAAALILQAEPWMGYRDVKSLLLETCTRGEITDRRGSSDCLLNVAALEDILDAPYDDNAAPFELAPTRGTARRKAGRGNRDRGGGDDGGGGGGGGGGGKSLRIDSRRAPFGGGSITSPPPPEDNDDEDYDYDDYDAVDLPQEEEEQEQEQEQEQEEADADDYTDEWVWERVFPVDDGSDESTAEREQALRSFASKPVDEANEEFEPPLQPQVGDPENLGACAIHAWELGRLDSGGGAARDVSANGADKRCHGSNVVDGKVDATARLYTSVAWDGRLSGPASDGATPDAADAASVEELLWRGDGLWLSGDGSFVEMAPPGDVGSDGANDAAINAYLRADGEGFALSTWVRVHEHRHHATLVDLHYWQSVAGRKADLGMPDVFRGGWAIEASFDGQLYARGWRHRGTPLLSSFSNKQNRGVSRGSLGVEQREVWNIDAIEVVASETGVLPESRWAHVVLNVYPNATADLLVNGTSVASVEHSVTRTGVADKDATFGLLPRLPPRKQPQPESAVRLLVGASAFPGDGNRSSLRARVADVRVYPRPLSTDELAAIRDWQLERGVVGPPGAPIVETAGMGNAVEGVCRAFLDSGRFCGEKMGALAAMFHDEAEDGSEAEGAEEEEAGGGSGGAARTRSMINGITANIHAHGLPASALHEEEVVLGCGLKCALVGGYCMGARDFCAFGAAVDGWCGAGSDGCVCCLGGLAPRSP